MKRKSILRITILPLMVFAALAFTNLQPKKDNDKNDKGNKSQEHGGDKGKSGDDKGKNIYKSQGNNNQAKSQGNKEVRNPGKDNNKLDKGPGNSKADNGKQENRNVYRSNGNSKSRNGNRNVDIDWNLGDFANRKHPKDQKKVTICHNPSSENSNNGVTINVSENALQAHLNHGDQRGNCNINYSDRWSDRYVKSRENVYNRYEQTWETMSYSEALLRLAADKLLGIRSNLDRSRSTLTSDEIQRREALIMDLQNNVYSLENQLGQTRQQLDSDVNIIIKL